MEIKSKEEYEQRKFKCRFVDTSNEDQIREQNKNIKVTRKNLIEEILKFDDSGM